GGGRHVGVIAAQGVALGARAAGVAGPGGVEVVAGGKAGGVPGEGAGGRVGLEDVPVGAGRTQSELVERVGAAGGGGGEGDRGAGQLGRAGGRGVGDRGAGLGGQVVAARGHDSVLASERVARDAGASGGAGPGGV